MYSPNAGVMIAHNDFVWSKLAEIELDINKMKGSPRFVDDERLCLELLRHDERLRYVVDVEE